MEPTFKSSLASNARVLKAKVSKQALFGLIVGILSVVIATLLVSYALTNQVSMAGIILAQKTNVALWMLDVSPFFFSFWGQYMSSILAYEASAMIIDETRELRMQTSALESQVAHDVTHDSLTGLPNNILFLDRLNQALASLRHEKMQLAVCMVGVEQMKEISNSLGRYNADRILKQLAVRLTSVIHEPNTIARVGDFEFAVLLTRINSAPDATLAIQKIHQALKTPFVLEDLTLNVQAKVGIALAPQHGVDADSLTQRAEIAMDAAKQDFSETVVYTSKLDKNSQRQLLLVNELRQAIEQDGLSLFYQPKLELATGNIALEVLLRWPHPQYGLILPNDFIPLAERNGLSSIIGTWVLNKTLQQCSHWQQQGIRICFSINLSALNLVDVELPDKIAGQLAGYAVLPEFLMVEITESSIMSDQERALQILTRLVELGVKISIDDFGTGYSSLAYLSKLPATELKIDKSFVGDMEQENNNKIVQAIIGLAHTLNLQVVAEGVETEKAFLQLKALNCDWVQGHFISPPLNLEELYAWLNTSPWSKLKLQSESIG